MISESGSTLMWPFNAASAVMPRMRLWEGTGRVQGGDFRSGRAANAALSEMFEEGEQVVRSLVAPGLGSGVEGGPTIEGSLF